MFRSIFLTEGNGFPAPSAEITFFDRAGYLIKDLALSEGNEIAILIGKDENDTNLRYRQYRYFTSRQEISSEGPLLKVICIYDAPLFFTSSHRESYEGTTSNVMKKIATKSALTYSGPEDFNGKQTKDSQIWKNIAKSRAGFLRQLWLHGYIGEGSCMGAVVNSDGQLTYRDWNDVINIDKKLIKTAFCLNYKKQIDDKKTFYVVEAVDRSEAGLSNSWLNYGHKRISNSLSGTDVIHSKISLPTQSAALSINSKVSTAVKSSRVDYSLLDVGNTHENYEKAKYQNLRLMSLFNQKISILVEDVTNVNLYDPVIYHQENEDGEESKNNGVYLVVGKTIASPDASSYCERIELARYETKLKDPDMKSYKKEYTETPVESAYINIGDRTLAEKVKSVTKPSSSILSNLNQALQTLKTSYGKTLVDNTKFIQANQNINQLAQSTLSMPHFGGNSVPNYQEVDGNLDKINAAYSDAITKIKPVANSLGQLSTLLGNQSTALKLSAISQLPVSPSQLLSALAYSKVRDAKTRQVMGSVYSTLGMGRSSNIPNIEHNYPKYPGYNFPSVPGTGQTVPGFPGVPDMIDFKTIPGSSVPGLPPIEDVGFLKGNNKLPSIPLPPMTKAKYENFTRLSSTYDTLLTDSCNSVGNLFGFKDKSTVDKDVFNNAGFGVTKQTANPDCVIYSSSDLYKAMPAIKTNIQESLVDLNDIQSWSEDA